MWETGSQIRLWSKPRSTFEARAPVCSSRREAQEGDSTDQRFVLPTKPQTCGTALELRAVLSLAALIVLSWLIMIPSVFRHGPDFQGVSVLSRSPG